MQQTGGEPFGGHQKNAEEDVGEIGDSRIGQAALPVRLPHCHHSAVDNRKNGKAEGKPLRPGAPQQSGIKAEPGQPHHSKGAGLDHSHRMEEGGHRRRGYRSLRQPHMEGEDG